jgi:hypothetical protein
LRSLPPAGYTPLGLRTVGAEGSRVLPWALIEGRNYFYESVRRDGRRVKPYRGTGAVAEAAAAEVERRKAVRAAARDALAAAERVHDDALVALEDLALQTELLTHAQLFAAGYHRTNDNPRRLRHDAPRPR